MSEGVSNSSSAEKPQRAISSGSPKRWSGRIDEHCVCYPCHLSLPTFVVELAVKLWWLVFSITVRRGCAWLEDLTLRQWRACALDCVQEAEASHLAVSVKASMLTCAVHICPDKASIFACVVKAVRHLRPLFHMCVLSFFSMFLLFPSVFCASAL